MLAASLPVLHRAYSLLSVKAVNDGSRTFEGVATTPTPDRIGDIVEPLGITFKNPLPLLLYHDHRSPVGTVKLLKPTKEGVLFRATLPAIEDPPHLRDRIAEAWAVVKAGLVGGVSIGFRPLNDAMELMLDTGGIRFKETEVLELSLVTVPANSDAVITTIKSLDAPYLAASGTGDTGTAPSPGAAGQPVRSATKDARRMTTQEQIVAFEAKRTAALAAMTSIMEKAAEAGTSLDAAEQEAYDAHERQVTDCVGHLARLATYEQLMKSQAQPVQAATPAQGSAARAGLAASHIVRVEPRLEPGIEFARFAACIATTKGDLSGALHVAQARYPDMPRLHTVLKAAVAGGTTTDATWAGNLVDYQNITSDFIEWLRPQTIVGKFGTGNIPSLNRVPFNVRILGQTSGGAGYWVGASMPKPVTSFSFAPTLLTWAKVANIAVLSDELVRFSTPSAETLVRNALAAALIERLDIDFIDPTKAAVANVSPASITNGVTALTHSGTDAAAIRAAVRTIVSAFISNNITLNSAVWIMSANIALTLSLSQNSLGQREFPEMTTTGGTFQGIPVIVSQYAALAGSPINNILILVNAQDIYLSDDGQVTIDASREASLQMDNAPTNTPAGVGSPGAPTATSLVSMFQTNSVAIRAERYINWARRRTGAVQWIQNVAWVP